MRTRHGRGPIGPTLRPEPSVRRRNSREIRQHGCSSWSPSPYSSPASLFGAACSIRWRGHDLPQSQRMGGHRRWRPRDLDQLTNAATWLHSPLTNSIYLHMLQRTLPAGFIAPCLPTKTDKLPSSSQWLHEIKNDGFRVIARKDGPRVRLYSRPGNDLTRRPADRQDVGTPALAILHQH